MAKLNIITVAPRLFQCAIDRDQTEMPHDYLPEAAGVVIAGEDMLRAAGHRPGASGPADWHPTVSGFERTGHDYTSVLWVEQWGEFFFIERLVMPNVSRAQTLVCAFGSRPIWTRTPQAAMRLADYCDPIPRPPVAGCWADAGPVRIDG